MDPVALATTPRAAKQITLYDIQVISAYIGTPRFIDIETLTKRYLFTSQLIMLQAISKARY
ncbi:hypothetical protein AUN02_21925 [Cronobacter sakazakii]|nr:hypothetical protein AUN02_21925 [Cronobacter sakazakii]PUW27842.1 hypothetical protein AUN01_02325 [Cronobacter sakazakii]PUW52938.1 hypothetical protein AUM94_21715 [Cronobacter sakazakii]PUW96486.1 hypothetical protein AUM92_03565 [Cronobacter sakazakii]